MNIETVANLYQLHDEDGIIISYHGTFLQEMIEEISEIINNHITTHTELERNGRYLALFVELSQNILRYSARSTINDDGRQISHGLILVGEKDNKIFVISGNPVNKENENILREKLSLLKNSTKDELKKLFKAKLKDDIKNSVLKKNAGLGLIDITRKADNMEYHFSKLDSGETFFSMKVEYLI